MDIEKLLGMPIESVEGVIVGEIVAIELYGAKVHIIIDSDFDFGSGGPDDNGGIPVEVKNTTESNEPQSKNTELGENVIAFRRVG